MRNEDGTPWYRQLWAWLVMVPPAAAVIAGITTVVIAASGADHVVRDDYVKVGLELREDDHREQAARALGLAANVHLIRADGRLTVVFRDGATVPDRLTLRLVHPTDAHRDRIATLNRDGNVFRGDLGQEAPGRWRVQVEPADRAWRLAGDLAADASAVALGTGT